MPTTCKQLIDSGVLAQIAACFDDQVIAAVLLAKCGVRRLAAAPFGTPSPLEWWQSVCRQLVQQGDSSFDLDRCLGQAAEIYPGNPAFQRFAGTETAAFEVPAGQTLFFGVPSDYDMPRILALIAAILDAISSLGHDNAIIGVGELGSLDLVVPQLDADAVSALVDALKPILARSGFAAPVQPASYHFRDYYSDPLTAEGPDGQRFAVDRIRASTRVRDVAIGIHDAYPKEMWPSTASLVVNRVTPEGERHRLDPRQTLHEAGVLPGDVLNVSPERTAGCFFAGTRIALQDEGDKPIEDLRPGDRLLGWDARADSPASVTVQRLFRAEATEYMEINGTTRVTASHPYWANGKWQAAGHLRPGDLMRSQSGEDVPLGSIIRETCPPTPVYNLYVTSPLHCFFADGFLVHNMIRKAATAHMGLADALFFATQGHLLSDESDGNEISARAAIDRLEQRLNALESMQHRVKRIEDVIDRIADGFSGFGAGLRRLRFAPVGAPRGAAQRSEPVVASIQIDGELDSFPRERVEELIDEVARYTDTSRDEIRLLEIKHGSVIVMIELPNTSADRLMTHLWNSGPLIVEFGITNIRIIPQLSGTTPQRLPLLAEPASEPARLLFLAAEPVGEGARLRLGQEVDAIEESLRRSGGRQRIAVVQKWAVTPDKLIEHLREYRPSIVHFSGHGNPTGDILFESSSGAGVSVPRLLLADVFRLLAEQTRLVVLNACYSESQAHAISGYVDCVVGTTDEIHDDAALHFSRSFYFMIGYGDSVRKAFDVAGVQIGLHGLDDSRVLRLIADRRSAAEVSF